MSADTNLLKGEVVDDPQSQSQKLDIEKLLRGLLRALIDEQKGTGDPAAPVIKETPTWQ